MLQAIEVDNDVPLPDEPKSPLPEKHTIAEATREIGSRSTVYKLINKGELEVITIGVKPYVINLRQFFARKVAEAKANAAAKAAERAEA